MTLARPVLVVSIPKAGTYLLAEVLSQLGITDTHWHIQPSSWQDYSAAPLESARVNPGIYTHHDPAAEVIGRIPAGSFAVSHLGPDSVPKELDIITIFLHRNLREVISSYARWNAANRRWTDKNGWQSEPDPARQLELFLEEHGVHLREDIFLASGWHGHNPNVSVSYEALTGRYGEEIQCAVMREIANTVGVHFSDDDLRDIISRALGAETLTKMKTPTNSRDCWTPGVENQFASSGLLALNRSIGYEPAELMRLQLAYAYAEKKDVPCPVCAHQNSEPLVEKDRYGIATIVELCRNCGTGFISPLPSQAWFDDFYRNYYWKIYSSGDFDGEESKSISRSSQILKQILRRHALAPSTCLDVGCGSGGMLAAFQEAFPDASIFGTDPSSDSIEKCRKYSGVELVQTSWLDRDSIPDRQPADFATMVHVLEHVPEPSRFLAAVREALVDDGLIYIEVPDLNSSVWSGLGFFHIAHVNYFTASSLADLLHKCGFKPLLQIDGAATEWPWATGILAKKNTVGDASYKPIAAINAQEFSQLKRDILFRVQREPVDGWTKRLRSTGVKIIKRVLRAAD